MSRKNTFKKYILNQLSQKNNHCQNGNISVKTPNINFNNFRIQTKKETSGSEKYPVSQQTPSSLKTESTQPQPNLPIRQINHELIQNDSLKSNFVHADLAAIQNRMINNIAVTENNIEKGFIGINNPDQVLESLLIIKTDYKQGSEAGKVVKAPNQLTDITKKAITKARRGFWSNLPFAVISTLTLPLVLTVSLMSLINGVEAFIDTMSSLFSNDIKSGSGRAGIMGNAIGAGANLQFGSLALWLGSFLLYPFRNMNTYHKIQSTAKELQSLITR